MVGKQGVDCGDTDYFSDKCAVNQTSNCCARLYLGPFDSGHPIACTSAHP